MDIDWLISQFPVEERVFLRKLVLFPGGVPTERHACRACLTRPEARFVAKRLDGICKVLCKLGLAAVSANTRMYRIQPLFMHSLQKSFAVHKREVKAIAEVEALFIPWALEVASASQRAGDFLPTSFHAALVDLLETLIHLCESMTGIRQHIHEVLSLPILYFTSIGGHTINLYMIQRLIDKFILKDNSDAISNLSYVVLIHQSGRCLMGNGQFERARQMMVIALRVVAPPTNTSGIHAAVYALALLDHGWCHSMLGDHIKAQELLLMAVQGFEAVGDPVQLVAAFNRLGSSQILMEQIDTAMVTLNRAVEVATACDWSLGKGEAFMNLGLCATHINDFAKGLKYCETALHIMEAGGHWENCAYVRLNKSNCLLGLGQKGAALEEGRQVLEIYTQMGNPSHIVTALNNLGVILYALEKYVEAEEKLLLAYRMYMLQHRIPKLVDIMRLLHSISTHTEDKSWQEKVMKMIHTHIGKAKSDDFLELIAQEIASRS